MRGERSDQEEGKKASEQARAAVGVPTNIISKLHGHKVRNSFSDINHIEQGQLLKKKKKGFLRL